MWPAGIKRNDIVNSNNDDDDNGEKPLLIN